MEHTAIDEFAALQMIQIISLSGNVPLVRVGKNDELLIKRVMDSGAHGVLVPMINNKEDAEKAVDSAKYPPKGKRGAGLSRAQNYGLGFQEYINWAEKNSVVIVQIEHIKAVENIQEILAVEGVDGFIIGPYDLSASLGIPGEFDNPKMIQVIDDINKIVKESVKPGGYHVVHSNHGLLQQKINDGYRFIAYGDDMVFFSEKIKTEEIVWKKFIKLKKEK
jgi:2-dehydro-3-deoxyglucarate aldolase